MIKLTLKTLPLSINQTYKRGKNSFYKSREAKDAQEAMGWEARSQYRGKPLIGPLKLQIGFWWPDRRKHDLDNGLKLLLDSMTGILWDDDSQIREMGLSKATDKENPRIEIEVVELP